LSEYLPEPILKRIDLNALTIAKDSFIDEDFKEHYSDILYSVPFRNSAAELLIYLLFEHKSYSDKWVALQLLRYLIKIWDQYLKQNPKAKKLPPIFPMVLYHGENKWHIADNFYSLVQDDEELLKPFTPEFRYQLYDISHLPDEQIRGEVIGKIVLLILKYSFKSELKQRLPEFISLLYHVANKSTALEILEVLLRYVVQATGQFDEKDIKEVIKQSSIGEDVMQTFIDKYIQQGKQEGSKQLLINQIESRFGNIPNWAKQKIELADAMLINQWGIRLLNSESLDDVIGDTV
jgi:predicted transposase/invertase (TIGR01784 family)